jgi:hypothetical protein
VALHEAWKLTGIVKMDLLQSVVDHLKALGQPYELARAGTVDGTVDMEEFDFSSPDLSFQLTDRDAILMRTDVDISMIGVQSQHFLKTITPPPPLTGIVQGGYVSVDAIIRGLPLRFVAVHLIPNRNTILQHTQELVQPGGIADTTLPLVFGGDFNTTADDPVHPSYVIYQTLINDRLTDAWKLLHPNQPGFTCCQAPDLLNKRSNLDLAPCPPGSLATTCPHRIDLILFRGLAGVDMKVFGDLPSDRTPSGLWPSDHAGLVATLAGPESQQFIADK